VLHKRLKQQDRLLYLQATCPVINPIKIFLASSAEFKDDRKEFEVLVSRGLSKTVNRSPAKLRGICQQL